MSDINNKPADTEENKVPEADALKEELEEICSMFQEALNENNKEPEQELIQELDYSANTDEEQDELPPTKQVMLCDCCGEKPCSKNHGENYPYCDSCRELMKRYPLRFSTVFSLLSMIAVFAVTCALFMYYYNDTAQFSNELDLIIEIQDNLDKGKAFSACELIESYGTSKESPSGKLDKLIIDSYWMAGSINDAKDYIETVFTKKELESPINSKYKEMVEITDSFSATMEKTSPIVSDAFSGKEYNYEEIMAQLNELSEATQEENGKPYNRALIAYYKNELMRLEGVNPEEQLEMLLSIDDSDKESCKWLIYPAICTAASRAGNEEVAKQYYEMAKQLNSQDMNAYVAYANYYRFLETPNAEKMLEISDEAQQASYTPQNYSSVADLSYYKIRTIAYLIQGEGSVALETMQQYMNNGYYTVADCNLYALCGLYCGNTDIYDSMKSVLENSGYTISDIVEQYKNQEITISQAIADKRGDIG